MKRRIFAFFFGLIGSALACGVVWFAAHVSAESVPTWGYALAAIFGHSDFYDSLIYAKHKELA